MCGTKHIQCGNFYVNDGLCPRWPMIEKVDKDIVKIEQDNHVSWHDFVMELNIDYKVVSGVT